MVLQRLRARWASFDPVGDEAARHVVAVHDPKVVLQQLLRMIGKSSKAAQRILLVHTLVTAYALLALAGVQDRDFYALLGAVKLPFLDVQMSAGTFFMVIPVVASAVWATLQFHLGQLRRLQRRVWLHQIAGQEVDPDLVFAGIFPLVPREGMTGAVMGTIYAFVVWWATPLLLFAYWARLLVLRSTIWDWLMGNGLPAARLVGIFAVAILAASVAWWWARAAVDVRVDALRPRLSRVRVWLCLALIADAITFVAFQRTWVEHWRPAQLASATLSIPGHDGANRAAGVHLAAARLPFAEMTGAFLESANLRDADLTEASLNDAVLRRAVLIGAKLKRTTFGGADLRAATLAYSKSYMTQFGRADLRKADLHEGDFTHASFLEAQLDEADLQRAILTGANLTGAQLSGAKAAGTRLENATLTGAIAVAAGFRGAQFVGARLLEADFRRANLREANLTGAHFEGAKLAGAELNGANLANAHLEGADLTGADLSRADLRNASLQGAVLRNARLCAARVDGALFEGADLRGITLAGAESQPDSLTEMQLPAPNLAAAPRASVCAGMPLAAGWSASPDDASCLALRAAALLEAPKKHGFAASHSDLFHRWMEPATSSGTPARSR